MMSRVAPNINLTERQKSILTKFSISRSLPKYLIYRSQIILESASGMQNKEIAKLVFLKRRNVSLWRKRWVEAKDILLEIEKEEDDNKYSKKIKGVLSDCVRSGAPPKFSAEAICRMISVACEAPDDSGNPLSHWSLESLRLEIIKRGIVENISSRHLGRFLKSSPCKTSQSRGVDSYAD